MEKRHLGKSGLINEELVGRTLQGRRNGVVLATKFGIVRNPAQPNVRSVNGRPDYVRSSCEGSLRRLGVETIDLYDIALIPGTKRRRYLEENLGALAGQINSC